MALRAGTQMLPRLTSRRSVLGWSGALAVGLAAVSLRSISSSHVLTGDIRFRNAITIPSRALLSRFLFSAPPSISHLMALTPPQPAPTWEHTPEDITKLTKQSIDRYRELMDKIGALKPEECNFDTVCGTLV